MRLTY